MLSNYNIKYICTIYTRLYTCLTSISRFALREKVTLRIVKRQLLARGCRREDQCAACKAKRMVLQCINGIGFKSRRGKNNNLTALTSNSNTVWFNFQTYIIFSINLVSLVTLRTSGTDILYDCHLLLDVCIIYFISCDCIINYLVSYTIY